jgi:chemotaxis protein MotB
MRLIRDLSVVVALAGMVMLSGCITEEQYNDIKAQNRIQQGRISDLESELNSANLMLAQLQKKLDALQSQSGTSMGAKDAEIAALEKDIAEKKALIERLQQQLLKGGQKLPTDLSLKLKEFAAANPDVTYDEASGMLKFKSDLLFKSGSADVEPKAAEQITRFCAIMNAAEGKDFDVIIAGHTDDQPIKFAAAKHPTNWHLSAHRAIGVLDVMVKAGVESKRASVRGFGEFRPIEPNQPGQKGNAANRRVEIYIVPSGA